MSTQDPKRLKQALFNYIVNGNFFSDTEIPLTEKIPSKTIVISDRYQISLKESDDSFIRRHSKE